MPPGIPEILWLQKTPRDLRGREDGRGGGVKHNRAVRSQNRRRWRLRRWGVEALAVEEVAVRARGKSRERLAIREQNREQAREQG